MVIYYDQMNFINVISMRYICTVEQVAEARADFLNKIYSITSCFRSQLFYTFEGVPNNASEVSVKNSLVSVRFFISVDDDTPPLKDEMQFDSYFSLGSTVCCCRLVAHEVGDIAEGQKNLHDFCIQNNWRPYTGVYYQLGMDDKNRYIMVKVGVCEPAPGPS